MRILVLSYYFEPDLCAGSFRCKALVDKLLEHGGVSIEVVTTLPNRYAGFSAEAEQLEVRGRLRVHRVQIPAHASGMVDQSKAFFAFYRGAKKIVAREDYDLVVATSSRLFTAFLGARVANSKGLPLYLDIRDIFVDTLADVLNPIISIPLMPILRIIENYTFGSASKINLVSKGFLNYFEARFKKPYDFFTNGIDDEFIKPVNYKRNQSDIKTILYAGNIGEGQGLHKIIPVLAERVAGEYHFLIIGGGGRETQLIEEVERAGVSNVEILGPVSREALVAQYEKADVLFMHLNDYQAFTKVLPSKVFEYAAMGKPILAGVSGFAADFVREHVDNAEVFAPCDADAGFSALQALRIEDKERSAFVEEFKRTNIMTHMAASIVSLGNSQR